MPRAPVTVPGPFALELGNPRLKDHVEGKEYQMPPRTFLILIVTLVAAAGLTIVLFSLLGLNWVWLGFAALVLTLVVRRLRW